MTTKIYYYTRWKAAKSENWYKSTTFSDEPTYEQAKEQLQNDMTYFYDDVVIELVKVTETVEVTTKGTQKRV
jgi:hypothetical protein